MEFVPRYTVSYHGEWYEAGVPFDIDPTDAEEMREHGEAMEVAAPPAPPELPKESDEPAEEKPRRGRPAKKEGLE